MTGKQRIQAILSHKIPDRIGIFEHFWPETIEKWRREGHFAQGVSPEDHFGLDMRNSWVFNYLADIDNASTIIEETGETKLVRDGNGALLRWWKNKSGTPEHLDYEMKDREGWETKIKPKLLDQSRFDDRRLLENMSDKISMSMMEEKFIILVLFIRFFCFQKGYFRSNPVLVRSRLKFGKGS